MFFYPDYALSVQNIPKNPDIFTFFNASVKSSRNMDLAILFNLNTTYCKHSKHKNIPGSVRSTGNLTFMHATKIKIIARKKRTKIHITWYSR